MTACLFLLSNLEAVANQLGLMPNLRKGARVRLHQRGRGGLDCGWWWKAKEEVSLSLGNANDVLFLTIEVCNWRVCGFVLLLFFVQLEIARLVDLGLALLILL